PAGVIPSERGRPARVFSRRAAIRGSWRGRVARNQRRLSVLFGVRVLAGHPFGDEKAILMPHPDLRAASRLGVPFPVGEGAADRLALARKGFWKSSPAPDDLPPGFLADDHISQIEHGLFLITSFLCRDGAACRGNGHRRKRFAPVGWAMAAEAP